MVKPNSRQKPKKVSFTRTEELDYRHKAFFLHYLHELEPGVKEALEKLLPMYRLLFGEHEAVDRDRLGHGDHFNLEFYSHYFALASWQENGPEPDFDLYARRYLTSKNQLLKTCEDYKDIRLNPLTEAKAFLIERARNECPPEILDDKAIGDMAIRTLYQHLAQEDSDLQECIEIEDSIKALLRDFRKSFFLTVIKRFHLEKEWLCLSAFLAIQEGRTRLEMPHTYTIHVYPTELLRELYGHKESDVLVHFLTDSPYPNELPLPPSFQFEKAFCIYDDPEQYEEQALDNYRKHIRQYVDRMQQALSSHGYKLKRRSPDYARVKWLVRWTVQGWTMAKIRAEYNVTEDTIWKAFRTFEKYDLPVIKKNTTQTGRKH